MVAPLVRPVPGRRNFLAGTWAVQGLGFFVWRKMLSANPSKSIEVSIFFSILLYTLMYLHVIPKFPQRILQRGPQNPNTPFGLPKAPPNQGLGFRMFRVLRV